MHINTCETTGTYALRDDLHLATPPPHPSEAPVTNPNPLATTVGPPTAGTKLSIVSLASRQPSNYLLRRYSTSNSRGSAGVQSSQNGSQEQSSSSPRKSVGPDIAFNGTASVFGEGNSALMAINGKESKDPLKRRKPKNNIVKSNSSFVSRVIPHESLNKRLQDRSIEGIFAFANINRAFQWLDLSSSEMEEPLTKVLFTKAHALCHDINPVTKGQSHLDVVMGYSTSDIIWYEPMSQKYARLNKNGMINQSAVSDIRWMPNSENLFLAAHMDGSLVVYDKEKEDAPFVSEEPENDGHVNGATNGTTNGTAPLLRVRKSVQSKNQKSNPVAFWKISNSKINSFAFSPDARHLAVVSEDGSLRIIDFLSEKIVDLYTSYYGGILCVCWSPDGRYFVTGGQDDLVSIWALADSALVARCQGHNSWVTNVAFDPWRCDDRNYRFGSIGEDCRLSLWDFNVSMLHRPKAASLRQRGSISGHLPVPGSARNRAESSVTRLRSNSNLSTRSLAEDEVVHPVVPKARVAMLPPVMVSSFVMRMYALHC